MRKLAAIMFTDIVGYTALMGEDEPKALQLLQKNREILKPIIKQFHGEWLKEIGDGTLSCFASAVDAVNCALEIQSVLKTDPELILRIGIHIGDVIFEAGDIFGDGVNVASRLEPLAEPGGIRVSERVHDDIRNKPDIQTVFLGEKKLKGVARPIKVYALTGEGLPEPGARREPAAVKAGFRANGRRFAVVGGGLLGLVLVFLGYLLFFGQPLRANEPIPTAVVDFINETGESELDGLSGMLITALEQSRRLTVLTRSRMFDVLKQLGKEDVDHIDEILGREIARQAHLEALVIASIRKFGKLYTIDLKVLDPRKDIYLFTAKEEGTGQESIPSMLDRLAVKMRKGLKERTREIEARNVQVAVVTTPNLEAYQHYFRGEELINKMQFEDAQEEFTKAIAIDSTFGLAYYRLAYTHYWVSDVVTEMTLLQKAVELTDRIPEKERYLVRALMVATEEGYGAGLPILKEMEQVYPYDKEMIFTIGDWNYHIGQYRTAVEYLEKTLALDPANVRALDHLAISFRDTRQLDRMLAVAQRYVDEVGSGEAYSLLGGAYTRMGDLETGLKTLQEARERGRGSPAITNTIADIYIFQERYDRAEAELVTLIDENQPFEARLFGYRQLAYYYPYTGKYREAIHASDKLLELYWQEGDTANAGVQHIYKGLMLVWGWKELDNAWKEARKTFQFRDRIRTFHPYWAYLAHLAVLHGDYALADSIAGFRATEWWYPYIQVSIHGSKHDCDSAESFTDTVRQTAPAFILIFDLYWLAECRLKAEQLDEAMESLLELQLVYDNAYGGRALRYPRIFYLLGKIHEKKGDLKLALENYGKFLEMWKDADEDLPDLIDAKARYKRLKASAL